MLFNSFEFLIFFAVVIGLFAWIKKFRWSILLTASYFFYMSWKWEYIFLIVVSTIVDYTCALKIENTQNSTTKKTFLFLSIFTNLSILFFFKYFGFFIGSFGSILGINPSLDHGFLLPVGISFYTFQTMSYTIDVYNGKTSVEKHFGRFALFVSYFPQLVAGPIERAGHLMHQLKNNLLLRKENIIPGSKQFTWGLFKKVVIADRLSLLVDPVYNDPGEFGGVMLGLATLLFAFQIYCDFSGYSDMAIGISRLFNVHLMQNFNAPYFSRSITEFWRKWHISLSTWFRDYVYIPLGGSSAVKWRWSYNIIITFLVSGLWHGANWTFVVWGGFHGALLIIEKLVPIPKNLSFIKIVITFVLVNIGWVFFRANNLSDASVIFNQMLFQRENFTILLTELISIGYSKLNIFISIVAISLLLLKDSALFRGSFTLKLMFYLMIIFMIIIFGVDDSKAFIYFQF